MNDLPRWLASAHRQAPPPAPPAGTNPLETALDDYEHLRSNYANLVAQSLEDQALLRELGHQNEALERTIQEDRAYFSGEIARIQKERDMLAAYAVQIATRMSVIVDTIQSAEREAKLGVIADLLRPPADQQDDAETERVAAGIVRVNPRDEGAA